jgi:hypothetical protein
MARATYLADLPGHLQTGFRRGRWGLGSYQLGRQMNRLLNVEGSAAFPAKGVARSVLNQAAEITADDFTCFGACQG